MISLIMKKTSETIVFFGNERLATGVTTSTPTLRALIEAGYTIGAVVSNETPGNSRKLRELEIAAVAKEHGIPLFLPSHPDEIKNQIREIGAIAAVLVAYGRIVPEEIINIFPKGIINIHPSLLPLHRGPTPLESVILEGATKTGVSIMRLVRAMDAGPVYAQREVPMTGSESKQDLSDILSMLGSEMIIEHLPAIIAGTLPALPQDDKKATYDKLLKKDDGIIDWQKPAAQIEREVRAFTEWPKTRTAIAGKDVIITKAHLADYEFHSDPENVPVPFITPDGKVGIPSHSEGVLVIDRLKPAGKNEMTAEAFIAGYLQTPN